MMNHKDKFELIKINGGFDDVFYKLISWDRKEDVVIRPSIFSAVVVKQRISTPCYYDVNFIFNDYKMKYGMKISWNQIEYITDLLEYSRFLSRHILKESECLHLTTQ